MSAFLENVALYLYQNYRDDLGDSVIIFPSRRAAVFFKKHMIAITNKTIWAPRLLTVTDFFLEQSDIIVIDELKLLFLLYKVFKEESKSEESFDQFYHWGSMLLNDFDDIDKYLVDARRLFQNIESLKELDNSYNGLSQKEIEIIKQFWTNFDPEKKSYHKQEFIKIWKVLFIIYSRYKEQLQNNNQGYEGMVFRNVVENIQQKNKINIPWKKVFFVGLNAITPCEYKVMKFLQRNEKADFFWDYDEFYLDKENEAGFFMRKNIKEFPPPDFNNAINNIKNIPKKIKVFSVASNIGQAKTICKALQDMSVSPGEEKIDTCLVLGDENLLIPVLYSIPKEIEKINVTMGFPLNNSTVYHFVRLFIDVNQSAKPSGHQDYVFYHQYVLALLNHQYISFWNDDARDLRVNIIEKNKIYISSKHLHKNSFFELLFKISDNVADFTDRLLEILYIIDNKMTIEEVAEPDNYSNNKSALDYRQVSLFEGSGDNFKSNKTKKYFEIEKEFIFQAYLVIKRLNEVLKEGNIKIEMSTFFRILKKALEAGKVDFIGEPLAGLQVMGALETRSIDFKNLLITSMNEGVFPKKTTVQSFIPYNLRKAFSLPTYEHQDAIYAYYFYRLLQRAENISLIYNSNSEGATGGEMSRFIYQLLYTSGLSVQIENVAFHIKGSLPIPIIIEKSHAINSVLNKYIAGKGTNILSPSAINYYKNCSLKFYFRYIAGLKEPDKVKEEIDYALFGNLIHVTLETIYNNFAEKDITESILDEILKSQNIIDNAIDKAFAGEYYKEEKNENIEYSGRNLIIKEIIKKYVKKIVEVDKKSAPFRIVSLEKKYHTAFPIFNGKIKVNIGGYIDRIDKQGEKYKIIDYKTGYRHDQFKSVEELFFPEKKGDTDAIAQIFMYSLLFNIIENKDKRTVLPILVFLRDIYLENFSMSINENQGPRKNIPVTDFTNYEDITKEMLTKLLEKLFGEENIFTQTDDIDYCKNCAYREICHR